MLVLGLVGNPGCKRRVGKEGEGPVPPPSLSL